MAIEQTYRMAPGAPSKDAAVRAGNEAAGNMSNMTTEQWSPTLVEIAPLGAGYTWRITSKSGVVVSPAPKVNGLPDGYLAYYERAAEIVARGGTPYGALVNLCNAWHERYTTAREVRGVVLSLRRGAA